MCKESGECNAAINDEEIFTCSHDIKVVGGKFHIWQLRAQKRKMKGHNMWVTISTLEYILDVKSYLHETPYHRIVNGNIFRG